MPIIATASSGATFTPAPDGTHQAVCVDVVDLGIVDDVWQGQKKKTHKIMIGWQIPETRDDGKLFVLFKRYTLSLGDKARLRADLESWRGRKFTDAELRGFDVETVKGANCLINISHTTKGDRTYANVVSVMPLIKGMPKLTAQDYERPNFGASSQASSQPDGHADEPLHDDVPVDDDPVTADDIPF